MIELLIFGGLIGFVLFNALRSIHEVNGVRHFTDGGRKHVLEILGKVSLAPAVGGAVVPGAITMQVVQQAMGIRGSDVVSAAESSGAIVLCSDSILDVATTGAAGPAVQAFVLTTGDAAVALSLAKSGSQWAILTP